MHQNPVLQNIQKSTLTQTTQASTTTNFYSNTIKAQPVQSVHSVQSIEEAKDNQVQKPMIIKRKLNSIILKRNQIQPKLEPLQDVPLSHSLVNADEIYIPQVEPMEDERFDIKDIIESKNKLTEEFVLEISGNQLIEEMDFLNLREQNLYTFESTKNLIELQAFKNLKILSLSHNKLIQANQLADIPLLEEVNLSFNYFKDLSFLNNCKNLVKVYASTNLINKTYLKNLPNLEILTLFNNQIENVEDSLKNINKNILELDLENNICCDKNNFQEKCLKMFKNLIKLNEKTVNRREFNKKNNLQINFKDPEQNELFQENKILNEEIKELQKTLLQEKINQKYFKSQLNKLETINLSYRNQDSINYKDKMKDIIQEININDDILLLQDETKEDIQDQINHQKELIQQISDENNQLQGNYENSLQRSTIFSQKLRETQEFNNILQKQSKFPLETAFDSDSEDDEINQMLSENQNELNDLKNEIKNMNQ